ncbi:MAG: S1 family peptidase [Ruminococcus sp.]|nr:S1 family peptidase [Ruminococcus sp.]
MKNEDFLNERFEALIQSYQNQRIKTQSNILNRNSECFPDYYAGAHLVDDSNLQILVTDKSDIDFLKDHFSSTMANIDIVENSMNDLMQAYEDISKISLSVKDTSVSVNQLKNRIDITCSSEENIEMMKANIVRHNINFNMLHFSIEDVTTRLCAQYAKSGNCIATPTFTEEGKTVSTKATILCNVYESRTKTYGVVTVDHIFDDYGRRDYLYLLKNNEIIGGVRKYIRDDENNQTNSGYELDCVWIGFTSSNIWTSNDRILNYLTYTNSGIVSGLGGVTSALEGSSVRKYGITTGREDGKIVSSYYSNSGFVNQMYCSTYNVEGDSGGPIGKWVSSSPNSMTLYGMTRALRKSNNYTIACKAANVLSGLGVSLYIPD